MTAAEVVRALDLAPLDPEGGFFRQTFKDPRTLFVDGKGRAASTCIYYLLTRESFSAVHRVLGTEIFHFLRGDAAEIVLFENGEATVTRLGAAIERGECPQFRVPPMAWQALRLAEGARLGWALFSTTVSPGFEYEDFELGKRQELVRDFPRHELLVRALTR